MTRTPLLLTAILLVTAAQVAPAQSEGSAPRRGKQGGLRMPENNLKPGDLAPDFTLSSADGKSKISLASFRGKRPVLLVFGSYT